MAETLARCALDFSMQSDVRGFEGWVGGVVCLKDLHLAILMYFTTADKILGTYVIFASLSRNAKNAKVGM